MVCTKAVRNTADLVQPSEFVEHLMRRPRDLVRQRLIQRRVTACTPWSH